ncbi:MULTISPECIES: 15-cis-phytoene synthase CrtB [unclassified Pseudomonas]|uniref:15-cis-phytoene synthase CrtB n=1 Tax=unclassified Pseudomonas TaxID=196821 RepID=UPI000EFA629E|nr:MULTISPECIES: 15-cis-phytoene synthase CrtB [unclassified Pseudomonas]AYN94044.1 phytoene/squalene synthase family protein [Pseudomonas sp. LTJR-52]MDN3234843.1 phytoene/squalene synthase family protein [Pseudomonas sp. WAC2]
MNTAVVEHATQSINVGSKSFAAAAKLFDEQTRQSAVMLYAWCRHCDDVVDGQDHGHGQVEGDRTASEARLHELEDLTRRAYAGEPMSEPAFAAFQQVIQRHAIPERYPLEHLAGFRMDVEERVYYRLDDTLQYCYHVAGVVGVMMAMLMGARDEDTLDRACDLGMAFQLTNIARDIVEDARIGRIYLPREWLDEAGIPVAELADPAHRVRLATLAQRLVALAEPYYDSAATGIADLPLRSAWSIATARAVYREIGLKVNARGPRAWDSRVSTSTVDKLRLVIRGALRALASRAGRSSPRPADLWTRPR